MNSLALFLWNKFPIVHSDKFLQKMKYAVIGIWICAALAGMFFTYRLGRYVEIRRHMIYVQTN